MLEDGLSYPVRGDWIGRILIGGVLSFLSVLLFPIFILMGYWVRVLEKTIAGEDEPPEFNDWGDLFVKGAIGTVIGLAYAIVPTIVYSVVVFGLIGVGAGIGGDGGGLIAGLGFMTMFAIIPLMLLIYYIVPAGLTNYAREGSIGAAFDINAIKPILLSTEYLAAVLFPMAVAVVLMIVNTILVFTVVGTVLVPFVGFYANVAIFRMFGSAFAKVGLTSTSRSASAPSSI
ncbi:DUF4013 domain-containing protein [Natrinema salaciae]|uniref:DUF4013 domain-containing protein n=1 Tax=Natrinema salaciae TaxID=1186196 RepID=A0A1H9QFZ7_9EURY|nr:DUF4013 domain-containing protein [Natrinema salaciae]SER58703.1 Protein of unknown function [Natrinema salaciae]